MNDLYVLDTDMVIDLLRGVTAVRERLRLVSPDNVAVSAMTLAELLYGADASSNPARNRSEVARFVERVRILPFGRRAAASHAKLRWQLRSSPIGPSDLIIAATVTAQSGTLVTANTREFRRVTGLVVENWRL